MPAGKTPRRSAADSAATSPPRRPPADEVAVSISAPGDQHDRLEVQAAPVGRMVARVAIEERAFERASAGEALGGIRSGLAPVQGTSGWQRLYDHAWVIWHPDFGACVLYRGSPIAMRYAALGGPSGPLGCPATDEVTVGPGTVCHFAAPGAAITWHPHLGAHVVQGAIGEYWLDTGGADGPWGLLASDEYDAGEGVRAVDFEGGTLTWRAGAGIARAPREPDPKQGAWMVLLDEPPRRAGAAARAQVPGLPQPAPTVLRPRAVNLSAAAMNREIEHSRALLDEVVPRQDRPPARPATTVTPVETLRVNGTELPPGVTAYDLHRAELDLWHDLWGGRDGPATINAFRNPPLTWGGFAADGDLEFLISTLVSRSPDARRLFLQVGLTVDETDHRPTFVVADTERGWRLYGADAERYIHAHAQLRVLLSAVGDGAVPAPLLAAASLPPNANSGLRQAALDAQFLTVITRAGRLPGWSLLPPWNSALRAAVVHNIHVGCLTGWAPYEATGGNPVEVVRTMAWDFFCGRAALLAQSPIRFEGAMSHGVLGKAARSFPEVAADDDGHARYIIAGSARRRVDPPA